MSYYVKGLFLDTPEIGRVRVRQGWALVEGECLSAFHTQEPKDQHTPVLDFGDQMILPGFADLHLHAAQYAYCGTAMDVELIQWLQEYAYPEESRFADPAYAQKQYALFVRDLKASATTRACIFASLHTDATLILMRLMEEAGLRGYVGKLAMNRNCPDTYREKSTEEGVLETERWLDACEEAGFSRVRPMLTPRFIPSVTDDYMAALGRIARERSVPMQSHLSENRDEIDWVRRLCPDTRFYGEAYARWGLFGGDCPTVMAHCIYSGEAECALMKRNGVMIAHCPTSNENVIAGIAPAARYLRRGWRIGLGSDVSGGHTLNLFSVMMAAIQNSKIYWRYVSQQEKPLTVADALYMATAGGGQFFGKVGLFEPGYQFDAIVLSEAGLNSTREFSPSERLERYVYRGSGIPQAKFCAGEKIV